MNVSKDGKICFEGLVGEWSPSISISQIIEAIIILLKEPKFDDPLNNDVAKVYNSNKNEYSKQAKEMTKKYAC